MIDAVLEFVDWLLSTAGIAAGLYLFVWAPVVLLVFWILVKRGGKDK